MKRGLIRLITFAAGLILVVEYFWPGRPGDWLDVSRRNYLDFTAVVGAFGLGVGWYQLVHGHAVKLARLRKGWFHSLGFLLTVVAAIGLGIYTRGMSPEHKPGEFAGPWPQQAWSYMTWGLMNPLVASVFSLLAFYVASAAYRAFRIKNWEAALMMAAAIIVMLGQVPVGNALTYHLPRWGQLPVWKTWIMATINGSAQRALLFGMAVGAIATSLRLWLGLERGAFFERRL